MALPANLLDANGFVAGTRAGGGEPTSALELLDLLNHRPEWMKDALCLEYPRWRQPHASWFPRKGEHVQLQRAREVCERCLCREECLAFALDEGLEDGIYGGLSGRQRKKLKAGP